MSRARHKNSNASKLNRAEGVGVATDLVSGNPNVVKEARERKKGGKVMPMLVEGKKAKHRADKPARKKGGRVGGTDATTSGGLYSSASRVVVPSRGGDTSNKC